MPPKLVLVLWRGAAEAFSPSLPYLSKTARFSLSDRVEYASPIFLKTSSASLGLSGFLSGCH